MRHRRPESDEPASGWWVRPYIRTHGRTEPSRQLPVEALVETTARGRQLAESLSGEHRAICRVCVTPVAVAEVITSCSLPLGTARVLLADLADLDLIHVHPPSHTVHDQPSLELLQRILDGLRRL